MTLIESKTVVSALGELLTFGERAVDVRKAWNTPGMDHMRREVTRLWPELAMALNHLKLDS